MAAIRRTDAGYRLVAEVLGSAPIPSGSRTHVGRGVRLRQQPPIEVDPDKQRLKTEPRSGSGLLMTELVPRTRMGIASGNHRRVPLQSAGFAPDSSQRVEPVGRVDKEDALILHRRTAMHRERRQ